MLCGNKVKSMVNVVPQTASGCRGSSGVGKGTFNPLSTLPRLPASIRCCRFPINGDVSPSKAHGKINTLMELLQID